MGGGLNKHIGMDTKLSENMRKEFHIKYTYSGKACKRSQHKPVTTQ